MCGKPCLHSRPQTAWEDLAQAKESGWGTNSFNAKVRGVSSLVSLITREWMRGEVPSRGSELLQDA